MVKKIVAIPYDNEWFKGGNYFFNELIESFISTNNDKLTYKLFSIYDIHKEDEYNAILSIRCNLFELLFSKINDIKKPIFLYHDDIHKFVFRYPILSTELKKIVKKVNIFFTPYISNVLNYSFYKNYKDKIVFMPFSVPDYLFDDCFDESWQSRACSIVLSGFISKNYPLRIRILKHLKKTNDRRVVFLAHPGYGSNEKGFIGIDYYNFLKKYKGAIATTLFNPINFTVMKYFEITACGCLGFFENTPDLEKIGFKDMINCILINKHNFREKFELINDTGIEEIAKSGYKLVQQRHRHSIRISEITKEIIKLLC